jgi:hypothetical protein
VCVRRLTLRLSVIRATELVDRGGIVLKALHGIGQDHRFAFGSVIIRERALPPCRILSEDTSLMVSGNGGRIRLTHLLVERIEHLLEFSRDLEREQFGRFVV